jgi:YHS domain-containing protein
MNRTTIAIIGASLSLVIGLTVWGTVTSQTEAGAESRAYLHSYNLPSSGVALDGYCPVAYFAVNKPVRGKPEHASTHNDVTYHFVSADAKRAFDRSPEKYIPAYGGWCAFGMSKQDKFPVDPTNFKIVHGRLMLFLRNKNVDALKRWKQDTESELVARAEMHWTKVGATVTP